MSDIVAKNSNPGRNTFFVDLLETESLPLYKKIAEKSLRLNKSGLSNETIARHVGVNGKTVAKVLRWIKDNSSF